MFKKREKVRLFLLFFQFFFTIDSFHFLLLMFDMSDGISLRMVHTGRSEEQAKEESNDSHPMHGLQT